MSIHVNCTGCDNVVNDGCKRYSNPEAQWTRIGGCAMATHNKVIDLKKDFIDPLKQSKWRSRGIR